MTIISHYWPYYESYWPYYESWLFLHSPPSFVAMKNKTRPLFIAQNHLHLGAQAAFNQGKYVDKKMADSTIKQWEFRHQTWI